MKINRFRIFLGPVTAALLVCLPSATAVFAADKAIVMTTSVDYPLYRRNGQGLYNLLLDEIFHRLQLEHELIRLPAQRSLAYTNNGTYDGNLARTALIETNNLNMLRVPEPVYAFEFMVYSRDLNLRVSGWDSLDPYVVGIINGWKIVERNVADAKLVTGVDGFEQLLLLLDKGRVDVAILDRVMGGWKLEQLGLDISALEPPLIKQPMYIYLHKRHADLVPRMSRVIREMKADGRFAEIYALTRVPRTID